MNTFTKLFLSCSGGQRHVPQELPLRTAIRCLHAGVDLVSTAHTPDGSMNALPKSAHGTPLATASTSSTHWTAVFQAGEGSSPEARRAFGEIYTNYRPALMLYLRHCGDPHDQAEDILQGFFAHLLEKNGLGQVRRSGRFRSWLLRGLTNFKRDQWAKDRTIKRGGGAIRFPVGLDLDANEVDPVDSCLTPEQAYDRKWAIVLLNQTLKELAAEYERKGKRALFEELKVFLSGSDRLHSHLDVGRRLGLEPNTVAVLIKRLRARYAALLRAQIADTVEPDQVEDEWRCLHEVLVAKPGGGSPGI